MWHVCTSQTSGVSQLETLCGHIFISHKKTSHFFLFFQDFKALHCIPKHKSLNYVSSLRNFMLWNSFEVGRWFYFSALPFFFFNFCSYRRSFSLSSIIVLFHSSSKDTLMKRYIILLKNNVLKHSAVFWKPW